MTRDAHGPNPETSALDAVLALETKLDDRHRVEQEAEALVSAARAEADLVRIRARHDAEVEADERYRRALADADDAAQRIVALARTRATARKTIAAADRPQAVQHVITHILPHAGGGE